VGAEEALRIGLVSVVVEDPVAEARKIAAEIATKGPLAVAAAKRVLDTATLEAEMHAFADLFKTADQKEGMKAFLEKRKPKWTSS
jgi:enoyl-CoA hydratase/carnithine racemase